ncbi:transcriptional regulator-like protein [Roseiflexus sp. RS-1]|nr:transcriptional regulator-like protein [Roseiflexus sp. RS-1]
MNRWSLWLADAPAALQRLIARTHRISLPRACPAAERLRRLRRALCTPAAVRAVYAALDADVRAALDELRGARRGLDAATLTARYGAVRPWRHLARDPQPRSVAERLLLLGWLLPRPAAPGRAPRFALAPEVRRWLPQPLRLADDGPAPPAPLPLAQRAALALLLVAAAAPLPLRRDGALRRRALRVLQPLLPDAPAPELARLFHFLLPLLEARGLVQRHGGQCAPALGAAAFLAAPLDDQRARLVEAWLHCAAPDAWLRRLRVASAGLDEPALRRRLVQWAQALPPDRLLAPEATYDALAATFGPLADAHTHGFRVVRRPPWRRRSEARVWQAALRGPLAWLGVVAWHAGRVVRPTTWALADGAWRYGAPGEVTAPFGALDAAALTLAQGGRWVRGDAGGLTVQVAGASGVQGDRVRRLLARRAGEAPDGWWGTRAADAPALRLAEGALLLADAPGDLERALRGRSVRRYAQRLAAGVALVRAEHVAAVTRALARQGIAVDRLPGGGALAAGGTLPAAPLAPGECAALLAACAYARRYAPEGLPLVIPATLEARLWQGVTPPLRAAVEAALASIEAPEAAGSGGTGSDAAPLCTDPDAVLRTVRRALTQQRLVTLAYETGGEGRITRRTVRPLGLERRGERWLLHAYCLQRRAERTFRLDRVRGCALAPPAERWVPEPAAAAVQPVRPDSALDPC